MTCTTYKHISSCRVGGGRSGGGGGGGDGGVNLRSETAE